jgi:hypothetical protein
VADQEEYYELTAEQQLGPFKERRRALEGEALRLEANLIGADPATKRNDERRLEDVNKARKELTEKIKKLEEKVD